MFMQNQCFIEVLNFEEFARYVCAFREHPLRVYSHELDGNKVFSTGIVLANTFLFFYTQSTKDGRYLSYVSKAGKEISDVVNSTKAISTYAPIINLESLPSPFKTKTEKLTDEFKPIKVKDLGSLARLIYDPQLFDEPDLTLFSFPFKKKYIIGKITAIEMDEVVYCFNYVELDSESTKPYLKYQGHEGKLPSFSDKFEHGYTYLPIIKLKQTHSIFGLS